MKMEKKRQNLTKINIFSLNRKLPLKKKFIKNLIYKILKDEDRDFKEINVIFSNNKLLKDLNRKFFKKNRPTNVISFNLNDIAEIYISQQIAKNSQELLFFLIHGLLHICGYDHKTTSEERLMEKRCWKYLKDEHLC